MTILNYRCCTPYTSTLLSWNKLSDIWQLICFSGSDSMVTSIVNVSTIFLFSGEAEDNVFHGLVARCKKWKLPRVKSLLALERKTFWLQNIPRYVNQNSLRHRIRHINSVSQKTTMKAKKTYFSWHPIQLFQSVCGSRKEKKGIQKMATTQNLHVVRFNCTTLATKVSIPIKKNSAWSKVKLQDMSASKHTLSIPHISRTHNSP